MRKMLGLALVGLMAVSSAKAVVIDLKTLPNQRFEVDFGALEVKSYTNGVLGTTNGANGDLKNVDGSSSYFAFRNGSSAVVNEKDGVKTVDWINRKADGWQ